MGVLEGGVGADEALELLQVLDRREDPRTAMKRAVGLRLTSSSSSLRLPPRSRITEAAWRGGVGGPA